jgi:hypothetical protein
VKGRSPVLKLAMRRIWRLVVLVFAVRLRLP